MDDRDGIEQQHFEEIQSTMRKNKTDKILPKVETRFKSKLEFFKKLPYTILSNNTVEKVRIFSRSSHLKTNDSTNDNKHELFSNERYTTVQTNPSSINFTVISENTQKMNTTLKPIVATTHISTPNIIRVDKINPNDTINHRICQNDQNNEYQLSSKYFQNKYKQYLTPTLLFPKQYYKYILNKDSHGYYTSAHIQDSNSFSSESILNPNMAYSTRIYSPSNYLISKNRISSNQSTSISLYNCQPNRCNKMKLSSDEVNDQSSISIIRPLPLSSTLIWNKCVRRVNREYQLTALALQQTKECLERNSLKSTHRKSDTSNMSAYDIKDLSNYPRKMPGNVTFCSSPSSVTSIVEYFPVPSTSIRKNEQQKMFPSIIFSKPKLIKPIRLETFSTSFPLNNLLSVDENNEKLDSIEKIIKKFNELTNSLATIKEESSSTINVNTANPDIDLNETLDKKSVIPSSIISSSSESIIINPNEPLEHSLHEEEITYTIETLYKSTNDNETDASSILPHIVIIKENATEEQFNLIHEKQNQQINLNDICSHHRLKNDESKFESYSNSLKTSELTENVRTNEILSDNSIKNASKTSITSSILSNRSSKMTTSSIKLYNNNRNNKTISQTSNHLTAKTNAKKNAACLELTPRIISSSTKLKSPSTITSKTSKPSIQTTRKIVNDKLSSQLSSNMKKQSLIPKNRSNEFQNQINSAINSTGKDRVKSIVNHINKNSSSHLIVSSTIKTSKRTYPCVSVHEKISTMKTSLQQK